MLPPLVLKFGGSVLRDAAGYAKAARQILDLARPAGGVGPKVVAVVSARHGDTDLRLGRECEFSDEATFVVHVAEGEADSCDHLGREIRALGLACSSLGLHETGIVTATGLRDASPLRYDGRFLTSLMADHDVILVPGHIGVDLARSRVSLLGRGGSDLTAVMVAHHLGSKCRFYKDVPGVLDERGTPMETISWRALESLGTAPFQEKAIGYASENGVRAEIGELGGERFTQITP